MYFFMRNDNNKKYFTKRNKKMKKKTFLSKPGFESSKRFLKTLILSTHISARFLTLFKVYTSIMSEDTVTKAKVFDKYISKDLEMLTEQAGLCLSQTPC